jgi:hypothetical protein
MASWLVVPNRRTPLNADPLDGRERHRLSNYTVYEHVSDFEEPEAIKVGFSWPAFFFTWIWAFVKRLPKHGVALLGIFIAITAIESALPSDGLVGEFSGLIWFAFSLVAGAYGNKWREADLANRDFEPVDRLEARSPSEAKEVLLAGGLQVGRQLDRAQR